MLGSKIAEMSLIWNHTNIHESLKANRSLNEHTRTYTSLLTGCGEKWILIRVLKFPRRTRYVKRESIWAYMSQYEPIWAYTSFHEFTQGYPSLWKPIRVYLEFILEVSPTASTTKYVVVKTSPLRLRSKKYPAFSFL